MRPLYLLLAALLGYFIYRYRFRLVNVVFKNSLIRKIAISSFMSIPFVRKNIMKTVFSNSTP